MTKRGTDGAPKLEMQAVRHVAARLQVEHDPKEIKKLIQVLRDLVALRLNPLKRSG
jgi:hypothetical protein